LTEIELLSTNLSGIYIPFTFWIQSTSIYSSLNLNLTLRDHIFEGRIQKAAFACFQDMKEKELARVSFFFEIAITTTKPMTT